MDSGLNSIGKLLESIVYVLFSVFSFLPAWCQVFVGSAFVFMIAVFIYKLIRG